MLYKYICISLLPIKHLRGASTIPHGLAPSCPRRTPPPDSSRGRSIPPGLAPVPIARSTPPIPPPCAIPGFPRPRFSPSIHDAPTPKMLAPNMTCPAPAPAPRRRRPHGYVAVASLVCSAGTVARLPPPPPLTRPPPQHLLWSGVAAALGDNNGETSATLP